MEHKLGLKKRWRRWLLLLIAFFLLSLLLLFGLNQFVKQSAKPFILTGLDASMQADFDCILVLGCGLQDGEPGPMLADRLRTGLTLYEAGFSDRLLMSGDHGQEEYNEVAAMKTFAVQGGVPSAHIFMDHAGFSTYESMYRAREVFCAERILIVTQDYHLYRAIYDARALGLDAYGVAADSPLYAGQGMRDAREVLARAKDLVFCLLKPAPTALGDSIPVSGDGSLTDDRRFHGY